MRSDLVFEARVHVPNRYSLCGLAAHATRRLHKPDDRIEDTMNEVLMLLRKDNPTSGSGISREDAVARAVSSTRVLRPIAPPIEYLDSTCVAISHAGSSPERIGA
jgi:hypothetical protein